MATVYACPTARPVLADRHPRQRAGDHQALDLARAFEDRVDGRVAVHGLHEGPESPEFSGIGRVLLRVPWVLLRVPRA